MLLFSLLKNCFISVVNNFSVLWAGTIKLGFKMRRCCDPATTTPTAPASPCYCLLPFPPSCSADTSQPLQLQANQPHTQNKTKTTDNTVIQTKSAHVYATWGGEGGRNTSRHLYCSLFNPIITSTSA